MRSAIGLVSIRTISLPRIAGFGFDGAWLGLWFPLDQVLFYPLSYRREERALELLRDADVVISAYWPA